MKEKQIQTLYPQAGKVTKRIALKNTIPSGKILLPYFPSRQGFRTITI